MHYAGTTRLNEEMNLVDVLYAPSFTHNLISVSQLTRYLDAKVLFLASHCLIQNKKNDHILGMRRVIGRLYVFRPVLNEVV